MLSCRCCETAYATANSAAVIAPTIDSAALAGATSAIGGTGASALLDLATLLSVLCIAIYGRINAFGIAYSGCDSRGGHEGLLYRSAFRAGRPLRAVASLAARQLASCKTLAIQVLDVAQRDYERSRP